MKLLQAALATCSGLALCGTAIEAEAKTKPNVIVFFADDISAREFPMYGSSTWSDLEGYDTSDMKLRAKTPVMNKLAEEGVFIKNAWGATVCSPSRAMMMTGRYAHLHKWWHNRDVGLSNNKKNPKAPSGKWPLYESSPMLIGHVAQKAGYGTYWAGKTQMPGDHTAYGFDEGCFTPGIDEGGKNPFNPFSMHYEKKGGKKLLINSDTGRKIKSYMQHSWYWKPYVQLMNHPSGGKKNFEWWPNTKQSKKEYGLGTYGPDIELDFIFDFMERQNKKKKPFFIYHTTHLGHDGYDWLKPERATKWPETPIVKWDGKKYTRIKPNITGEKGVYDNHGTITGPGIYNHVNYIDYQIWLYLNKLKKLGVDDNTILIITADNGTSKYGKTSPDRQKGTHVPFIVYAPGFNFTKSGMQDMVANLADVYPTLADIVGTKIPKDYEINGKSLWPYLTSKKAEHREWVYAYRNHMQLVRGQKVMKDGYGKWWDVSRTPDDLISFPEIKDWEKMPPEHRAEREKFIEAIKPFDKHATEHDDPTYVENAKDKKRRLQKENKKKNKKKNKNKKNK